MEDVHISSYANLVLLQRLYTQLENRRWAKSRKEFLNKELREKGKLTCHYCQRQVKINPVLKCEQATVDHVVAKSAGGDEFCPSNFAVCCFGCNKRKASHSALDFLNSTYIKKKRQTNGHT